MADPEIPTIPMSVVKSAIYLWLIFATAGCGDRVDTPLTEFGRVAVLTPEMRIDGATEGLIPGQVAVRNDGVVAFAPFRQGRILFYSSAGAYIGTVSEEDEFPAVSRIGWQADTLWTWDSDQRRISLISPDLEVARIVDEVGGQRDSLLYDGRDLYFSTYPLAFYSDGSLMAHIGMETRPFPEPFWADGQAAGIISSEKEVLRILVRPRPENRTVVVAGEGVIYIPFTVPTAWAVSPDGGLLASAMGFVTDQAAGSLAVSVWGKDGGEVYRKNHVIDLERIPQSVKDNVISARVAQLAGRPGMDAAMREMKLPDYYPPIDVPGVSLVVSRDSTVWLRLRPASSYRPTVVLDPSGEVFGTVILPPDARIVAAELDRIWVFEPDSAGGVDLVRYQISWQ
jgi:hypothetical protein